MCVHGIISGSKYKAHRVLIRYERGSTTYKLSHNPLQLVALSRPLFAAQARLQINAHRSTEAEGAHSCNNALARTLDFVREKLLFERDWAAKSTVPKQADDIFHPRNLQLFCVASVLFWLIPAVAATRDVMLKQHMAVCSGISSDRRTLVVGYKSEPALGEAALRSVLSDDIFLDMLQVLRMNLHAGAVQTSGGTGEVGELLASVLLMRTNCVAIAQSAMSTPATEEGSAASSAASGGSKEREESETASPVHRRVLRTSACGNALSGATRFRAEEASFSRPVPLLHLLRELLSKTQFTALEEALQHSRLLHGVVCFNHFKKVEHQPMKYDLQRMLGRYMAVLCEANTEGVDIIVPVAMPKPGQKPSQGALVVDIHDATTFDVGALHVQVKVWKNSFSTQSQYNSNRANSTTQDLGDDNILFLIVNLGTGDSSDFAGEAVVVLDRVKTHSQVAAQSYSPPAVLQLLHCQEDAGRPPCITEEMHQAMRAIRGSADPLVLWREDQERVDVDNETIDAMLQDFDPGLASFTTEDEDPFSALP
jgi:hypothetical protein